MTVTATHAPPAPVRPEVPEIVRRRLAPFDARRDPWSWVVAGIVTAIAAIVRLVALNRPDHIVFDEVYYAPNAYSLWRYGVEWAVPEDGAHPVDGAPVLGDGPAYVVHPPLGKWLIGLGEWIFGYNAFGWRIAAAVAGILSVLLIVRIARRLFHSTVLGGAAGLLVALDGMHLVMSRTALLDIFLMFFLVAAFGALVLDRDSRRRRWLRALERGLDPRQPGRPGRPAFDWRTGVPWWRLAAGGLLGCALAVKWTAGFFIPVFLVLVVIWEVGTRRSAGVRRPGRDTLLDETGWLVATGLVTAGVYLASWTGWLATDHGYLRHWRADTGQDEPPVLGALLNLVHYHREAMSFHSGLDAEHTYQSSPWEWLLLARPIAFHWGGEGTECGAPSCASEILLVGTPMLWWAFLPAVAIAIWLGVARRDWRVPAILLPAAAGIVPWLFFDDRTMFYFYALPSQPFLVLTVVYVLGALFTTAGRPGRQRWFGLDRRLVAGVLVGGYVALVALNFAYFYPIYTAEVITYEQWQARMWLGNRWI